WGSLLGYACLAGIGFTMTLFIAMLAFDETGPGNTAKSGILAGSVLAGIAGAIILRVATGFRNDE
ncbi:MAG: Na+/H+ antiporter NhaA, partial [Candidatus Udaeobacter sp.]